MVPLHGVESPEAIELDLATDIGVAQNVIPGDVELLRTLVAEEYNRWPLDLIVVLEVELELHLAYLVLEGVNSILDLHELEALVRLIQINLDGVHVYLPDWLELQYLLKIVVVLVKFSPYVLKEQLVKVLDGDVLVTLVVAPIFALDLGEYVQVLLGHIAATPCLGLLLRALFDIVAATTVV